MMTSSSQLSRTTAVLTSPIFVGTVGVLLVNDWVLKAAAGNWLTGKVSDFAGLAAFSMFWAAVFPRHRRAVFIVTGAAFVFWKSPLSEGALQAWNALGVWPLTRVQDYSDLLALSILVPTHWLLREMDNRGSTRPGTLVRRISAIATGVTAMIAFSATSVYRATPIEEMAHSIPGARDEVIAALDSLQIPVSDRSKRQSSTYADTLVVHIRHPPERWLAITIEVHDAGPGQSRIRPIALGPHGPPPTPEAVRRAFAAQIVQPLREWLARRGDRRHSARGASIVVLETI
jgi:hypothetical protein